MQAEGIRRQSKGSITSKKANALKENTKKSISKLCELLIEGGVHEAVSVVLTNCLVLAVPSSGSAFCMTGAYVDAAVFIRTKTALNGTGV